MIRTLDDLIKSHYQTTHSPKLVHLLTHHTHFDMFTYQWDATFFYYKALCLSSARSAGELMYCTPPFDWETTNQVILFNIPLYLECFVCFFNE